MDFFDKISFESNNHAFYTAAASLTIELEWSRSRTK